MSTPLRIGVLGAGLVLLAVVVVAALHAIPPSGHYRGPYGDVINAAAPAERLVTNSVTAVNFDYRGIDTIGEEFVLFVAVAGVTIVLRRTRDERSTPAARGRADRADQADPATALPRISDAVRLAALAFVGPVLLLGVYIVAHGQLTPGGGFQGGVILATAILLVYLGGRYRRMRRIGRTSVAEVLEAVGAGGFVLVGATVMATGVAFLTNALPLGTLGYLTSGGTIPIINALVGLEVSAAVVIVLSEFLEQALELRPAGGRS